MFNYNHNLTKRSQPSQLTNLIYELVFNYIFGLNPHMMIQSWDLSSLWLINSNLKKKDVVVLVN